MELHSVLACQHDLAAYLGRPFLQTAGPSKPEHYFQIVFNCGDGFLSSNETFSSFFSRKLLLGF